MGNQTISKPIIDFNAESIRTPREVATLKKIKRQYKDVKDLIRPLYAKIVEEIGVIPEDPHYKLNIEVTRLPYQRGRIIHGYENGRPVLGKPILRTVSARIEQYRNESTVTFNDLLRYSRDEDNIAGIVLLHEIDHQIRDSLNRPLPEVGTDEELMKVAEEYGRRDVSRTIANHSEYLLKKSWN